MGFEKTGTPSLVSKVASVCRCGSCSKEAMCVLKDGAYLCPDCLGPEPVAGQDGPQDGPQDGQNGPQDSQDGLQDQEGEPHAASIQDSQEEEGPHVAS